MKPIKKLEIDEYFPIVEGSEWHYFALCSQVESKCTLTELTEHGENEFHYKIAESFKDQKQIWEYRIKRIGNNKHELYAANVDGEFTHDLQLPLRPGMRWELGDEDRITICTVTAENIKIGKETVRDCLKVEYRSSKEPRPYTIEWYAKGIGLVKDVDVCSSHADESELIRYRSGDGKTDIRIIDDETLKIWHSPEFFDEYWEQQYKENKYWK